MPQNKPLAGTWIRIATIAALCLALLSACGGKGAGTEPAAVYKNDAQGSEQTVTEKELDGFIGVNLTLSPGAEYLQEMPNFRLDMLKQLIAFRILASRYDGAERDTYVKEAKDNSDQVMEYLATYLGSKNQVKQFMKEQKFTENDMVNYFTSARLASEYLRSLVSEDDLRSEYDRNVAEDPSYYVSVATVSHILISTEERSKEEALAIAREVRGKLLGGADFAEMAKEYSEDPDSKDNGGTYADANVNLWVPEFRQAALELPLHEISEPVETDYGYHIIRVDDRKMPAFEDVKEQIESELVFERFNDFMNNELDKLIVSIAYSEEAGDDGEGASGEGSSGEDTAGEDAAN
jgi:foldase protein PrsA